MIRLDFVEFGFIQDLFPFIGFTADYGNSFSDVVQSLVHLVENLGSGHISAPSSFKYRIALEKQV